MITIHEAKAGDFTTLGLGALLPSECTVRERAGGMYELKIVHPITKDGRHHRIKPMRIIKAPAPVRETPLVEIGQAGSVSRDIYKVATNGMRLNMRAGASMESKVIHAYKPGTEVCRLGSDGDWMQVSILDGGATGWMWADNLEYVRTETETVAGDTPGKVVQPRQTREQLFRIYRYSPDTKERAVTAEARHITYDLAGAVVDGEYSPENVPANQVCAQLMAKADHNVSDFHIYCTVSTPISGEYGGRNILDCLLDPETGIVAQAKARIVRDNYDIFILPDEVRSRGVELRYGKNLLSAYMDTDVSDTITRIKPVGKTRDGEKLYIEENGGWVESPYISDYPVVYSKEVEYDVVESDELPIEQARMLLKEKAEADFLAGCDMATVKLDADFVRLELTEDYKHLANQYALHLYDSVPVIDRDADIVATARMTEYAYDAIIDEYQDTGLGELEEVGSTIYGYELAAGSVSGGKLIPNTVNGDRLQNSTVSYGKFDLAAIKQLSADAIVAIRADIRELVAGNITTDQLYADIAVIAAAQITAANIEKANIQWAEIENLSAEIAKVVKAEVENLEVDWAGIYEADIEWANIENLTAEIAKITAAEIGKAKINWAQIVDVKIGTADIEDASINTAKIALGAITQALIAAGAIGTAQIADGSITSAKVVDLSADVIKSGTLSTERLLIKGAGGLFYEINATAGGLTASQLTEEQYKNAISGTALVARSVTADKIAAKTITANEIMSGTITAAEINVANLFAAEATIAALDNYILRTQTIEAIEGQLDVWASEKIRLAVDNIQVGGTNLVRIGEGTLGLINGFADRNWGKSAWCQSGVGVILWIPNSDYNGVHFNTNIPVSAGKYTLSFYAWSYGVDVQPVLRCNLFNGTAGIDHYFYDVLIQPNTPTRYEIPVTVSYQEIVNLRMLTWTQWTTGEMYISDVKFEKGTKATDWSPAPGDTDAAIDKLSTELVIQEGDITANATKIETVNAAAGNAQSAANAAQNTANAAQNAANTAQGTANGAVTRVTAAETRISAVEGAIVNKVEKTEFDTLGRTVSDMQTSIEENGEEILFLAGRTVGGTNLLRNTGVLKAANYSFDASGASAMGGYEEDGESGFHIWCQNANVRWWLGDQPVTSGQDYVTSVRYRINAAGNQAIQFQYVLKNASNDAVNYWDSVNHGTTSTITEDGWTVLRNAITIPDGASVVRIAVRTGVDGALYTCDYNVRRPKFEAGNMPTDWTPSPYDPSNGVDTGNSSVKVRITPDTFDVDVPGTDGDFTLNRTGARIPIVNADIVNAQNLAYRYYGAADIYVNAAASSAQIAAGSHYRSLTDALNALSGKYIPYDVRIHVESDTYGDAAFNATSGCAVVINGNGYTLYGSIMNVNSACSLDINNLTVNRPSASGNAHALYLYRCGYTSMYQCTFIAAGTDTAVNIAQGVKVFMHDCELRSADKLIYLWYNSELQALNLKGGECTNYLVINGATARWGGTRPDGVYAEWNTSLMRPDDLNGLTIDYGTAQPSVPAIQTASWNYLYSDSYRSGWQWFSDDDIRQGYDGGVIYGVIWFDAAAIRSALNGKTINQVSLRLYMAKGVGRGVNVNVELYGSNVSYDRTAAPALTTSYGSIGETQPDVVNEITIPAQAVKDMISGTINALVLRSSDSEYHKDRPYSRNYAKFAGSTTATAENCPRLTVVYQ